MGMTLSSETFEAPQLVPLTVLLVDDQQIIFEAVKRMVQDHPDIILHYCSESTQAIKMAHELRPTVILQDLVMPDVDGLTLVRAFRADPLLADIPLIVLSTKEDPVVKAEAFALGANDYLVKLPDKIELVARIRYHSKAFTNLLERNRAFQKLDESQRILKQELAEAAEYVRSLLPSPLTGVIQTKSRYIPSTMLGGDSFGYYWYDEDHFVLYLLDVCGHGVGSAVFSISVLNVLRSQTLPNTNFLEPAEVLESLNETFQMESHNNMFFTIWYGVFNKKDKTLKYSSGGHPPVIYFSKESQRSPPGTVVKGKELQTPGVVIGGMPGIKFHQATQEIEEGSRIYLFSDGVYEITRPDGTVLTLDEFVDVLSVSIKEGDGTLDKVQKFTQELNGPGPYSDDYSIVEFVFTS